MNPWTLLQQGLGAILAFFYGLIPNYGIAIILLTVAISLLLFPLTLKQTRSMQGMQAIQPEVKKLQKELKGDREELNKQLMALYRERGVNPAAGCLPLLAQMPVWFALFQVLRVREVSAALDPSGIIPGGSALETALLAGNTRFLGMDLLTSPSNALQEGVVAVLPYAILVLIVVAAGYYQQRQMTAQQANRNPNGPKSPAQGALKFMPVFFGVISVGFPAGLVVYFASSNIFRVAQQSVIIRLDHDESDSEPTGGATPQGEGPQGPERTPPRGRSPHGSKKRNRRRRK